MTAPLPAAESLHHEFKSDLKRLPDRDLALAVVCLANTQGGTLWLGVEDDGRITGLHPERGAETAIAVLIANRTSPAIAVRVTLLELEGHRVAHIEVPRSTRPVATTDGTLQRRRLLADGRPECVPMLPHELVSRESELGLLDYSALPVARAALADLDPLERLRLRQAIERYAGDRSLLALSDEDLDGALGLARTDARTRVPTVAGLLLIGKEASIREHLPTHEVAFQVLDHQEVKVNDFYRWPLVRLFERLEEQFAVRVIEQEVQVGLFRVPVPSIDRRSFREALVNALTHRDYARLGAVHIQWRRDTLTISSPGGFVDGVTADNLLTIEPRPRNPVLADAFKRIGLSERTGRGVDLIYEGLLRAGRRRPDYSRSQSSGVVVELDGGEADLDFLAMVVSHERDSNHRLGIDALLVLSALRSEGRLGAVDLADHTREAPARVRTTLNALVESGLVEAHGQGRARTYTLASGVYRRQGRTLDYVRQTAIDSIRHEEMVLKLLDAQGQVRREDVVQLCHLNAEQAKYLLRKMTEAGTLRRIGMGRSSRYEKVHR